MKSNLREQFAVEQVGPGDYMSLSVPRDFGQGHAYGGTTTSVAISAAFATVPDGYFLHSLVGTFLGPATLKAKLHCTVHATRNTRNFATRRVVVNQEQPNGTTRTCLEVIADFHVPELAMLEFTTVPTLNYKPPNECLPLKRLVEKAVSDGVVKEDFIAKYAPGLYDIDACFDTRTCTEGMSGQNLCMGKLANLPTSQDNLPVADRVSADWVRVHVESLPSLSEKTVGEKTAALVFLMDEAVPFFSLVHNNLSFEDCGRLNTLEFALRIFVPVVDLGNEWHLRERKTIVAGLGRSYNEARLFDEKGNLEVSMTQQCIVRPVSDSRPKSSL